MNLAIKSELLIIINKQSVYNKVITYVIIFNVSQILKNSILHLTKLYITQHKIISLWKDISEKVNK